MPADDARLSQIATRWTLLFQAHNAEAPTRGIAQTELLRRYCAPVYQYLFALVRDPVIAEELCQEFALRFVRGDFWRADQGRGRFRDYLKTAIVHLAGEHRRRARPVTDARFAAVKERVVPSPAEEDEKLFLEVWRAELMNRAWASLEESASLAPSRGYLVLRLKCEDPGRTSMAIAEELSQKYGTAVTASGVRQTLHRAREQFAELLRSEVAASLPSANDDEVDAELAALGLLSFMPAKAKLSRDY